MKRIIVAFLIAMAASPAKAQTWMQSHQSYVHGYWHSAFESPKPHARMLDLAPQVPAPAPPTSPSDVYVMGAMGANFQYGVTNNFDMGACVERELHDGQWLAGGCKDVLYLLRKDSSGDWVKGAHLGGAYMANAQHGNESFQLKAGVDLGTLAAMGANGLALAAPKLADIKLPSWTGYIGNALTLDFAGGYRPVHDSSVTGNWTYGIMASVNVPVATTFEWLISGL